MTDRTEYNLIPMEEKMKSVTMEVIKEDWYFLKNYKHRFTSKNKYPHKTRGAIQNIAWAKWDMSREARNELYDIYLEFWVEGFCRNRKEDRSIDNLHIHFFN